MIKKEWFSTIEKINIWFGLGGLILVYTYYHQHVGSYYSGAKLTYYIDTLREKPIFIDNRKKRNDYYQFQLSYSKSKFFIQDNSLLIIQNDIDKIIDINALEIGDTLIIGYPLNQKIDINWTDANIKIITLATNHRSILSKEEVLKSDNFEKYLLYLLGFACIICGCIGLYLRKTKN
jgi:hypothetical protein